MHSHARRFSSTMIAMITVFIVSAAPFSTWADGPDPTAAMQAADAAMYPASFSVTVAISTERPGEASTTMEMQASHKSGRGSFIEFLAPARLKGTRLLQTDGALWMYSPRAGSRTPLRLSPRESFQGSAFSNNDIGDPSWSNDYQASLVGSGVVDHPDFGQAEVWIISGKALRRDVPYGEIRVYLKKGDLLPLRIDYFAKSGLPLKVMDLSDFASTAGRLRPRRMVMTSAAGTGEKSVVLMSDLRERTDLPDAMFNQSWLTR